MGSLLGYGVAADAQHIVRRLGRGAGGAEDFVLVLLQRSEPGRNIGDVLRWIVRQSGFGREHHAADFRDQLFAGVMLVLRIVAARSGERLAIKALSLPLQWMSS
jgi:hypothetical protein